LAYVLILFSWVKRSFQATLDPGPGEFRVLRGQGRQRRDPAWLYCRDDTQRYSIGVSKLSSDEARRIGKAIARIPEFLMQRQGFYQRGGGSRWRADRPYHVALEDRYIREHWDEVDALCKLNSLPFNATGEVIEDVGVWRIYEFTWQMDAILFWDRFEGRWLRGTEFHYPERPENLPSLKALQYWPKFNPRNLR
jgi:hypothetical protein